MYRFHCKGQFVAGSGALRVVWSGLAHPPPPSFQVYRFIIVEGDLQLLLSVVCFLIDLEDETS